MKSHKRSAFTLLELLLAVAVLLVLMAILTPAMQQMRLRSSQMKCQNNLRAIGTILLTASQEQGPTAKFWYTGSAGIMWNTMLVTQRYVTHAELQSMSCPDITYAAANGSVSGRHYGVFFGAPEGKVESAKEASGSTGNVYSLPIRSHSAPASAVFLVDSATTGGAPSIRCFTGSGSQAGSVGGGGVHLRHRGQANLFFLDGHIEVSTRPRLAELGVGRVLNARFQLEALPSMP